MSSLLTSVAFDGRTVASTPSIITRHQRLARCNFHAHDSSLQAIPSLLGMLKDGVAVVRDSAAWIIGHMCDLVSNVIDETNLGQILQAFFFSLDDEPRVAKNICWVRWMNFPPSQDHVKTSGSSLRISFLAPTQAAHIHVHPIMRCSL